MPLRFARSLPGVGEHRGTERRKFAGITVVALRCEVDDPTKKSAGPEHSDPALERVPLLVLLGAWPGETSPFG
jgi:hypothetical protein